LGTVAATLASKVKAQRINRTVKGVGDAVKDVAKSVLHTTERYSEPVGRCWMDLTYGERLVADKGRSRLVKSALKAR